MQKKILLLFLLASFAARSQNLYTTVHNYFRQDPFGKPFAQFLNSLVNDPALLEKDIKKKTDSTLFYLQGIYTVHKPFFFPTQQCRVILSEQQDFTDTTETETYSYFVYQLIGYAAPGDEGIRDVKEEYERLSKKLKKGIKDTNQKELKRGSATTGMILNYLYGDMLFAPMTLAWVSTVDKKENIVALTVRFVIRENQAFLPIASNSP